MSKSIILISVIGMVSGFLLCISAAESNTLFAVGFSLFLGNMSMFYLTLKNSSKGSGPIEHYQKRDSNS